MKLRPTIWWTKVSRREYCHLPVRLKGHWLLILCWCTLRSVLLMIWMSGILCSTFITHFMGGDRKRVYLKTDEIPALEIKESIACWLHCWIYLMSAVYFFYNFSSTFILLDYNSFFIQIQLDNAILVQRFINNFISSWKYRLMVWWMKIKTNKK